MNSLLPLFVDDEGEDDEEDGEDVEKEEDEYVAPPACRRMRGLNVELGMKGDKDDVGEGRSKSRRPATTRSARAVLMISFVLCTRVAW